jgi:ubiquitin-protein ligase
LPIEQKAPISNTCPAPETYREDLIVEQFPQCRGLKLQVYYCDGKIDQWRIFLPGNPIDSYSPVWDLSCVFPADYPHSVPVFRFISCPNDFGVLTDDDVLGRSKYHPAIPISWLIANISKVLRERSHRFDAESLMRQWRERATGRVLLDVEHIRILAPANPGPWTAEAAAGIRVSDVKFSAISWKQLDGKDRDDFGDGVFVSVAEGEYVRGRCRPQ